MANRPQNSRPSLAPLHRTYHRLSHISPSTFSNHAEFASYQTARSSQHRSPPRSKNTSKLSRTANNMSTPHGTQPTSAHIRNSHSPCYRTQSSIHLTLHRPRRSSRPHQPWHNRRPRHRHRLRPHPSGPRLATKWSHVVSTSVANAAARRAVLATPRPAPAVVNTYTQQTNRARHSVVPSAYMMRMGHTHACRAQA